jgi:hypothetical protein
MQPCSQPRYGFKLVSKPTSGLVLRVIMVLVPSRKYCVGRRGASSVSKLTSTTSGSVKSRCNLSNRFAGLQDAPRPRIASWLWGVSRITGLNFLFPDTRDVHMNISRCRAILSVTAILATDYSSPITSFRRGGRAVDRAGLENRKAERSREFESHPLRPYDSRGVPKAATRCTKPSHNARRPDQHE